MVSHKGNNAFKISMGDKKKGAHDVSAAFFSTMGTDTIIFCK